MIYDIAVIGGGIAGLTSGFFAKQQGATVALISQNGIMQGASSAAGAFLHPAMGNPSILKSFNDKAFNEAVDFYSKYCNYEPNGAWIGARDEKTVAEFMPLGNFIPSKFNYDQHPQEFNSDGCGAFFIENAGRISPNVAGNILQKSLDAVFIKDAINFKKTSDIWSINGEIFAKNIIFACGASDYAFNLPYLKKAHRSVWGQKAILKTQNAPQNSISIRGVLISERLDNNTVAVGATHVQTNKPLEITNEISLSLADNAKRYFDFGNFTTHTAQGGMRSASTDYFPIVGNIYDDTGAMLEYPSMKNGFIPKELPKLDGLFVNYGHGSRGFSASVYTSKVLIDYILENKTLEKTIDTKRLLVRFARKHFK